VQLCHNIFLHSEIFQTNYPAQLDNHKTMLYNRALLKNKRNIVLLIIIYFALFLNTGHLCFCNDVDPVSGICHCCEHEQNSTFSHPQTNNCDCCLSIKSDAAKLAAEKSFDLHFLQETHSFHHEYILKNLNLENIIKSYTLNYVAFRQQTNMLKTVILLN